MNKIAIGIVVLSFALTGCKKSGDKKSEDNKPSKGVKDGKDGKGVKGDKGDTTMTSKTPRKQPKRVAPKFEEYKPLAELIKATKKCKKAVFTDCAEGKALDKWTGDVRMNRIKLSEADRIRAWKTAATLVLHPDKKIRNFAASVFQIDPFSLRDKISKNPKLIHIRFIKNLLKALPTLETFRSGWLMSYIPYYAPGYGLLDECFKAADKCKNKQNIYERTLKGFPKYSRLKHFAITKKYAADSSKDKIKLAKAALSGLLSFTWNKKEAKTVCYWLQNLLNKKVAKEAMANEPYYLYRYLNVAERCQVLDSKKHLGFITKMKDTMKMLKGLKWDSKDYKKTVGKLKGHWTKLAKKLK